jgi:hypothetical protein
MPYEPLPIGDHVPAPVRALIESVVDGALKEIRFIMEVNPPPDVGPKGHLQLSLAKLLLSAIDGAAQLLVPGVMGDGGRFKRFLMDNFPWDRVELGGESAVRELASEFMWDSARCALIHRYGLHTKGDLRKFGRLFTINDEQLTALERGQQPGKGFFEMAPTTRPLPRAGLLRCRPTGRGSTTTRSSALCIDRRSWPAPGANTGERRRYAGTIRAGRGGRDPGRDRPRRTFISRPEPQVPKPDR